MMGLVCWWCGRTFFLLGSDGAGSCCVRTGRRLRLGAPALLLLLVPAGILPLLRCACSRSCWWCQGSFVLPRIASNCACGPPGRQWSP